MDLDYVDTTATGNLITQDFNSKRLRKKNNYLLTTRLESAAPDTVGGGSIRSEKHHGELKPEVIKKIAKLEREIDRDQTNSPKTKKYLKKAMLKEVYKKASNFI